jgi:alpha-mannosidase
MKTVHLIFNAHLDPVWLWPWQAGLDAVLATCRSACDRLDAHPDLIFTKADAWFFEQVEKVDPALFKRVHAYVAAGRWSLAGGWWIQPDCNLPSEFGLGKQIQMGKEYFTQHFGTFPKVAYNVDSFGHAAGLPDLMRQAGQEYYVMMRPQEGEMKLPARLFRWRGHETGREVITFRIARAYTHWSPDATDQIKACLTELPEGIDHTMCFLGVGDHGGGPTEAQIVWLKQNWNAFDGVKLEFSSPQRFFDAIAGQVASLPLVTGELQHHAIGCYTVHRPVKLGVRRGEHLLRQAEIALGLDPQPESGSEMKVHAAWRQVVFHHFHDTLGGTCIPSAYEQVEAQLGHARSAADSILQYSLRRQMNALPDDPRQRVVLFNASDRPYHGYTAIEPWMNWRSWQPSWRLIDEQGHVLLQQSASSEAVVGGQVRVMARVHAEPGQIRVLRIDESGQAGEPAELRNPVSAGLDWIDNGDSVTANPGGRWLRFGDMVLAVPRLDLLEDLSDTWSHGMDRYSEAPVGGVTWSEPCLVETGPVMATQVQQGRFGESRVLAEYRVYAHEPFVELRLRVHWTEQFKILKMVLPLPAGTTQRRDGVLGAAIDRALDGAERPLRDWIRLAPSNGQAVAIVAPEVFAVDATPLRVRFTLLRSPRMAHHDPCRRSDPRDRFCDQGEHEFVFRFYAGVNLNDQYLEDQALMLHRPLVMADLTRGMKP